MRLWSVIILVQVALGDDCKYSSVFLLFPKALVVYIYEIGMMVVILLHKGSVEVRHLYIEWKYQRQDENVDILLFIAVRSCRYYREQPVRSILETTSVFWEEEEGQDFVAPGAFI